MTYIYVIVGTLPAFSDGNMTVEACMQTNQSVCEESVNIVIRNCEGYFVYYLRPTPANSSYCFGNVFVFNNNSQRLDIKMWNTIFIFWFMV